jgi:hypothetical protein
MAVYFVEYNVGGNRSSSKVKATGFSWSAAGGIVAFVEGGKTVANFANVSAVIDIEHMEKARGRPGIEAV